MAWKYVVYKPENKFVVKKYSGERYAGNWQAFQNIKDAEEYRDQMNKWIKEKDLDDIIKQVKGEVKW